MFTRQDQGPRPMQAVLPPANILDHQSSMPPNSTATPSSGTMFRFHASHHMPHQHSQRPDLLDPYNGTANNRQYSLTVEQQPVRARMCGFGDKDRRPITPPPCIRLTVRDVVTGKEVDFNDIESTFFVLNVDLWSHDGTQEVNLVRHSSGAPTVSISTSTTTSFPPPPDRHPYTGVYQPMSGFPSHHLQYPQPMYPHGHQAPPNPSTPNQYHYGLAQPQYMQPQMPIPQTAAPTTGMFTRNLIGSLTVNAFRLNDTEGKPGFWFVLQDLSVRTEGTFRLKMSFVDVGSGQNNNTLNQGRAPVLATVFSDAFQVYSAKKFPGVIESTALSKTFAGQGIKIPIRKDGPKSGRDEYEDD